MIVELFNVSGSRMTEGEYVAMPVPVANIHSRFPAASGLHHVPSLAAAFNTVSPNLELLQMAGSAAVRYFE